MTGFLMTQLIYICQKTAVIYLEFKQRAKPFWIFRQKDSDGIANSEDPDQTAPQGAV